jgi:hypothetical protein
MHEWAPQLAKSKSWWLASFLTSGFLFLALVLVDSRSAAALPIPTAKVYAIPAFARKYGMP